MKTNVIKAALKTINENGGRNTTITRCGGGRRLHRDANYLVRIKTGTPRQLDDGSQWDGWETVGHFRTAGDAAAAAIDASECA